MRNFALALLASLCLVSPVSAKMLIGVVQYHNVEGRIGIRTNYHGTVFRVHPNSPAENVGLKKGDVITLVDGKKNNVDHIHGPPGTLVTMRVH